jgi:NTP pyrophosphatase (non-canonical NTP hydrolase)
MGTLNDVVQKYIDARNLTEPNYQEAMLWLASEVGELADSLLSLDDKWVRNRPEDKSGGLDWVHDEVGDVLMMLTVVCNKLDGADPIGCLFEKMRKYGFDPDDILEE